MTALQERQYPVFVQQFLIDGAQAIQVYFDGVEIEQRYPKFVGCVISCRAL